MATKAQIKREERARKAAAKVVHKALLVAFKEIARAECRAASTTPPLWGVYLGRHQDARVGEGR